jgi:uncharacterized membrane protein YfcA
MLSKPLATVAEAQREAPCVGRHLAVAMYIVALIGVVVGIDALVSRHNTWAQLLANVGVVLVFVAFHLCFQSTFGDKLG